MTNLSYNVVWFPSDARSQGINWDDFDLYNQHKMDTDLVIHNQAIGHSV